MLVQTGIEIVLEIPLNKTVLAETNSGRCCKIKVTQQYYFRTPQNLQENYRQNGHTAIMNGSSVLQKL